MNTKLLLAFSALLFFTQLTAQRNCGSSAYRKEAISQDPSLASKIDAIEKFTSHSIASSANMLSRGDQVNIIKIPVVVHVLYHYPSEKISDAVVASQIAALNRDFRRQAADTTNTPARFKSLAADCEIEFQLAISDPQHRSTNGIIRKYTPVTEWEADDAVKFSDQMGDDAWDPKSYLNIWVCSLDQVAGYSSVPGGPANKDGVVIGFRVFGTINAMANFDMGKTAVHEVGHWLNLMHTWGDADCGTDFVDDTPQQSGYNIGCPSGIRITCGNAPTGDMYMNYMDFVNDECMNIFTKGQKARMRALFDPGGLRYSILSSTGLTQPLISEIALPDVSPEWLHLQLFPNPATTQLTLDLSYDSRWVGNIIYVSNLQGQRVMQFQITAKSQQVDISKLQSGMYFLSAKKDDGDHFKQKFIKL